MNNIEGKVVIITGASSGISRSNCENRNLDAKIVLAARRKERLEVLKTD